MLVRARGTGYATDETLLPLYIPLGLAARVENAGRVLGLMRSKWRRDDD